MVGVPLLAVEEGLPQPYLLAPVLVPAARCLEVPVVFAGTCGRVQRGSQSSIHTCTSPGSLQSCERELTRQQA